MSVLTQHQASSPGDTTSQVMVCERIEDGEDVAFMVGTDPVGSANLVAQQAFASLTIDVPAVETAPPADALLLVGIRAWFWVDNAGPLTATATIPGLSATVTATPATTTFTIDDHTTLDCPDGGTPYDPDTPGQHQDQTCTHVFQTNGTHTIEATTTWNLTWTATNGTTGTLPDLTRTTTHTLPVHAAEATTH